MRLNALAGVLAAGCLLWVSACGPGGPPGVKVDPAMLTLAPQDTVALIGIRMDHLRETPFWDKHVASGRAPGLDGLIEKTRVDPEKLWEILAAYNGSTLVVMARGKFTEGGLEPRLDWDGARRTSYKGYLIVEDALTAVTFMNASTALAGSPNRVRQIIDQRDQAAGPPQELIRLIEGIDRSNQIWAVSRGGFSTPEEGLRGPAANLDRVLRKVESFRAMANLNNGMLFRAEGTCQTAEDAETLRSAVKALIGLARFGGRDKPDLVALYDTIAIGGTEDTVTIDADVSVQLLDAVIASGLPGARP